MQGPTSPDTPADDDTADGTSANEPSRPQDATADTADPDAEYEPL